MRILIAVMLMVGLIATTLPAFAGEPVINHIADAFSGKNDFVETWGYLAYTVKETVSIKGIPILLKGTRIKGSTPIGDNCFEKGILEVGIEF